MHLCDRYSLPYSQDMTRFASRLADLAGFVWLNCGVTGQAGTEYVSALPDVSIEEQYQELVLRHCEKKGEKTDSGEMTLTRLLRRIESSDTDTGIERFNGVLLGYLSYNYKEAERVKKKRCGDGPTQTQPSAGTPALQVGFYDWVVRCDHQLERITVMFASTCSNKTRQFVLSRLKGANQAGEAFRLAAPFHQDQQPDTYAQSFLRIQSYIQAGDCYQINYAQRFSADYLGDPFHAFCLIRQQVSAPYAAFIRTGAGAVLCFSPERFLTIKNGKVLTAPIKGTRPRGTTEEDDTALKAELSQSAKDRAENLMIVDLLRNDLSVHSEVGSVCVEKLFEIQSFHNVHHMVSTISARKKADVHALRVLLDAFPGGSITGAPKKRAMEIIAELEPHERSVYCGSVFCCTDRNNLDSNIAIRTLLCENGSIYCWGGGGIVADSDMEQEYAESINKVAFFMNALEQAFLAK